MFFYCREKLLKCTYSLKKQSLMTLEEMLEVPLFTFLSSLNVAETQSDPGLLRIPGSWPHTVFLDGPCTLTSAGSHAQGPLMPQSQKRSTHGHGGGALHLLCMLVRTSQKERRRHLLTRSLCVCVCACSVLFCFILHILSRITSLCFMFSYSTYWRWCLGHR